MPIIQTKTKLITIHIFIIAGLVFQLVQLVGVSLNLRFNAEHAAILGYLNYLYSIVMHLILILLVLAEAKNLEEFHVDKFSIITFLVFSILRPMYGFWSANCFLVLIALTSITTIILLIRKKPKLLKTNLRFSLLGIVAGAVLLILLAYLALAFGFIWSPVPLLQNSTILGPVALIAREFSSGALLEELLFRGFFWGYLKRQILDEKRIYWIQFLIFWFLHLRRAVTAPFTFFVSIPLLTILSSQLTLRSKQIFPAVLSHTVINVLSTLLNLAAH